MSASTGMVVQQDMTDVVQLFDDIDIATEILCMLNWQSKFCSTDHLEQRVEEDQPEQPGPDDLPARQDAHRRRHPARTDPLLCIRLSLHQQE